MVHQYKVLQHRGQGMTYTDCTCLGWVVAGHKVSEVGSLSTCESCRNRGVAAEERQPSQAAPGTAPIGSRSGAIERRVIPDTCWARHQDLEGHFRFEQQPVQQPVGVAPLPACGCSPPPSYVPSTPCGSP